MPGSVRDLIRKRLGVGATPRINRSLSSVGTTAVRLWPNDPDRLAALAVNLSVNAMFALLTPDVATTKGIRMNAQGGFMLLFWEEDLDLTYWEWFVVADAAASPILTVEWLAVDMGGGG